ncbi:MAG: hypothetical protein ACLR1V_16555 [Coprococcus sp.]
MCGVTEEDEISEHKYGEWTVVKAATCTEKRYRTENMCRLCDVQTRSIPATGHKYEEERVKGYNMYRRRPFEVLPRTKCGDTYTKVEPATGHDMETRGWTVVRPAKCTEPGLEEKVCNNWNTDGTPL